MKNQLTEMLVLAATKHGGQVDRGGAAYILHPLKVMHDLRDHDDEELLCIALGHDLIEDTDVTSFDLVAMGFSNRVVKGIEALTKNSWENHEEYYARIKANPDAVKVKMRDLMHNMNLRRLKDVTKDDIERQKRYGRFLAELESVEFEG